MIVSDEALSEYISECREIIERLNQDIAQIERNELGADLLDSVYRDMHTLKGTSQLFGFQHIGQLTHALETCLEPVRKNKSELTIVMIDILYKSVDLVDKIVADIESKKSDERYAEEVNAILFQLIEAATNEFLHPAVLTKETIVAETIQDLSDLRSSMEIAPPESENNNVEDTNLDALYEIASSVYAKAERGTTTSTASESPIESAADSEADLDADLSKNVPEPRVENSRKPSVEGEKAEASPEAENKKVDSKSNDNSIRVQVSLLDRLMDRIGELVLVRNQVLQYTSQQDNIELVNISQSLNVVTSELQEEVMKTRMQPIGNILSRFQRMVRDLAKDLGKKIDITLEGKDTELDKTLLEAIKDPLTHILRNACDHGIEFPKERLAAGKPDNGHIYIRSYHEGGQVIVEVSDDGKGMNRVAISNRAIEKGLITAERSTQMADRDVFALVFEPGFSTAEKVSSVSGRGVGMDVVKTNIERIGGTFDLDSSLGKGTTIKLKIPLTLAIVPAMVIRCGKERIAIPQGKLVELVRIERERNSKHIEFLENQPMLRLRGDLLPLVDSYRALGFSSVEASQDRLHNLDEVNIVVLNAEGLLFGFIVDEVLDTADIVVKPLSKIIRNTRLFSGATIECPQNKR